MNRLALGPMAGSSLAIAAALASSVAASVPPSQRQRSETRTPFAALIRRARAALEQTEALSLRIEKMDCGDAALDAACDAADAAERAFEQLARAVLETPAPDTYGVLEKIRFGLLIDPDGIGTRNWADAIQNPKECGDRDPRTYLIHAGHAYTAIAMNNLEALDTIPAVGTVNREGCRQ